MNRWWRSTAKARHGTLAAQGSPDAPVCADCHNAHGTQGKLDSTSPTYSRNIPTLCAKCHQDGQKAAVRYTGKQDHIVDHYRESIHGKGLLQSGLTVTANCADCHTPHHELPSADPRSSVNRANIAETCAQCHRGIYELFTASVHSAKVTKSGKPLPDCADCHSAHSIQRTDRSELPPRNHGPVRTLPPADHGGVLRNLSRQGIQARLSEDRQVLRLPWRARHSAGHRPALAPEPQQHRRHLRQVPHRLAPPVRRLPDPRHPSRSRRSIRSCSSPSGA